MRILSVVKELAHQIVKNGELSQVEHRPESDAEYGVCFRNVGQKIERDGGTSQFGWAFQSGKGFVMAVHHCIWRGSGGQLVDITPFDQMRKPVFADGTVVFLPDDSATPIKPPGYEYGLARPNRVHVYSSKADTAFVSQLLQQEREWEQELATFREMERAAAAGYERVVREAALRGGCGTCQACCEALAVKEIDKTCWQRCEHQCATGCSIYHARPKSCEIFYCLYLAGSTPADLKYRPDNLGILFSLDVGRTADNLFEAVVLDCRELWPGAFAANPWVKQLAEEIAERNGCPNVWWYPHNQTAHSWDELEIADTPK